MAMNVRPESVDPTRHRKPENAYHTLTAIIRNSADAIYTYDLQGIIQLWNPGAERMFGYPAAEAIGNDISLVVPEEQVEAAFDFLRQIQEQKPYVTETERVRKDGSRFPVSLSIAPLGLDEGTYYGVCAICRDITEQKLAQDSLARNTRRQSLLLELTRSMIAAGMDEATLSQLVFATIKDHFHADIFLNYRLDRAKQMNLVASSGIPGELQDRAANLQYGEAFCGTVAAEQRALVADKARISEDARGQLVQSAHAHAYACVPLFSSDGRVLGTYSIASTKRDSFSSDDVDFFQTICHFLSLAWERIRLEKASRESEQRTQLALEAGAMFAFEWNLETDVIRRSAHCGPILGDLMESIRESGKAFQNRIFPADLGNIRKTLERITPQDERYVAEYRILRGDGSIATLSESGRGIFDRTGRLVRLIGITMDVTERKRSEQALREAKEAAEAANKAKDNFLAALSHELRTPLTPVLILAGAMEQDPSISAEFRTDCAAIRRNILVEARLIDDLLDLTRIARDKIELHPVEADLHGLIKECFELLKSDAKTKGIEVQFRLSAHHHVGLCDPGRMRQVFWNLLSNAIKFTPSGGTITVESVFNSDDEFQFRITDTGIGMGPEEIARAFDAFAQGDHALHPGRGFGGLGLGLSLSKRFIELHGGKIWAESAGHGSGSTFSLRLPLPGDE